jgi:hypothetical protein
MFHWMHAASNRGGTVNRYRLELAGTQLGIPAATPVPRPTTPWAGQAASSFLKETKKAGKKAGKSTEH